MSIHPWPHDPDFETARHNYFLAASQRAPNRDAHGSALLWNPKTGIFDPAQLRLAIVMRGWTVVEFAKAAAVSRGCLYSALLGSGVTDRTAIRIFQTLATRDPYSLSL
jgi:hypothetical protein